MPIKIGDEIIHFFEDEVDYFRETAPFIGR
jgi:hypothetical protein